MIWGGHATFVVALAAVQTPSRAIAFQQEARSSYVFGFLVSGVYATDAALVLAGFAAAIVGLSEEREAVPASAVAFASAAWVARRALRFVTSYVLLVAPVALVLLELTGPQKEVLPGVVAPGNAWPRCQSWAQAAAAGLGLQALGDASLRQQCVPWAFPASIAGWSSLLVVAAVAGSNGLALALDAGAARVAGQLPALRPWLARLSARRLTAAQYERLARDEPGAGGGGRGRDGPRNEAAALEAAFDAGATRADHRGSEATLLDERRGAAGTGGGSSDAGAMLRRRQPPATGGRPQLERPAGGAAAAAAAVQPRRPGVSLSFSPRGVAWALLALLFASLTLARAIGRPLGAEARTLSLEGGAAPEAQTLLRARLNLWSLAPAAAAGAMASFGLGSASSSHRRLTRLETVAGAAAALLVVALGLTDWYALALLAPQSQLCRSVAAALYRPCLTAAWAVALRLAVRLGAERALLRGLRGGRAGQALQALAAGVAPASLIQPLLALAVAAAVPGTASLGPAGATGVSLACSGAALVLALPVTFAGRVVSGLALPAAFAGEDGVLGDGATIGRAVLAAGIVPSGGSRSDAGHRAGGGEGQAGLTGGLGAGEAPLLTPADRAFFASRAALLGVAGVLRVDIHMDDDVVGDGGADGGRPGGSQAGATAPAAASARAAGIGASALAVAGAGDAASDAASGSGSGSDSDSSDDDDEGEEEDEADEDYEGAASESGASSSSSEGEDSDGSDADDEGGAEHGGEGGGRGQPRLEAVARALRLLCAGDPLQPGGVERLSELCVAWEEETGATAAQAIAVLRLATDGAVQEAAELGLV